MMPNFIQEKAHYFEDGYIVCPTGTPVETGVGINYCPMCGRDLPPDIEVRY